MPTPPPPLPLAELPLMVQLVSVVVSVPPTGGGRYGTAPPPLPTAELPLTVQLVSVVVPPSMHAGRRRRLGGGVAADGAVGQRGRATECRCTGRRRGGGVAADGAVGQRGRAPVSAQAAAAGVPAELPLTVQLVSVIVPAAGLGRCRWSGRRHRSTAELPLTVQLCQRRSCQSCTGRRHNRVVPESRCRR